MNPHCSYCGDGLKTYSITSKVGKGPIELTAEFEGVDGWLELYKDKVSFEKDHLINLSPFLIKIIHNMYKYKEFNKEGIVNLIVEMIIDLNLNTFIKLSTDDEKLYTGELKTYYKSNTTINKFNL